MRSPESGTNDTFFQVSNPGGVPTLNAAEVTSTPGSFQYTRTGDRTGHRDAGEPNLLRCRFVKLIGDSEWRIRASFGQEDGATWDVRDVRVKRARAAALLGTVRSAEVMLSIGCDVAELGACGLARHSGSVSWARRPGPSPI
jgi:hypothetical protein